MKTAMYPGTWAQGAWDYDPYRAGLAGDRGEFENTCGMKLLPVAAACFKMGGGRLEEDADCLPVHEAEVSRFHIAAEPVRLDAFNEFWRETHGAEADREARHGFVVGVSWYEAAEFCRWLSGREGLLYRLPTEAEWEYCARNSAAIGADRFCCLEMREWCLDWYGDYTDEKRTDWGGPASSMTKCVRGGFLDDPNKYNCFTLEPWRRSSLPPDFCHMDGDPNAFGRHPVGFRVVCGAVPKIGPAVTLGMSVGVHQDAAHTLRAVPDPEKPYFRKREIFTIPPDDSPQDDIVASGESPMFRHHHHSPGFAVAPNGDLLYTVYSSYHEYDAGVGLAGARLRRGCEAWEPVEIFINVVDVNDHAPSMFTDEDGTVYAFWGSPILQSTFPFQYIASKDSGMSWSPVRFPRFTDKLDARYVVAQPVNTCVRASDGAFYMVSDWENGSSSVLWRTRDNMRTWQDPKGRTAGRHTTAVELKDGRLLAMGGKNSDIDGHMPKAISSDGGDSWDVSPTPFPRLNSGQRPCIIRLASGRLAMCGDYQDKTGFKPPEFADVSGSYCAWSDDEGESWHIRKLWGTAKRKHHSKNPAAFGGADTIGYTVMRQAPDGLIHIVTSHNRPALHFEFNEAWLIGHDPNEFPGDELLMASHATRIAGERVTTTERYPAELGGGVRCRWTGGVADDGRFLLDGPEECFWPNGKPMFTGSFRLGVRVGEHIRFDEDGFPIQKLDCDGAGTQVRTTYWAGSDAPRTVCAFVGGRAEGEAVTTARDGKQISCEQFRGGKRV